MVLALAYGKTEALKHPLPVLACKIRPRNRTPLGCLMLSSLPACFRNLTRPKILKTPGVVIEPLRYNKALERDAASLPANNANRKSIAVVSNGMRKHSKR